MKQLAAGLIFLLAEISGLNWLFKRLNKNKIRILMYHGVTAEARPTFIWTQMPLAKFRRQMQYLRKHYQVIDPETMIGKNYAGKHGAVITFDDGLKSVYVNARQVLEQNGLKAICFVLPQLSERGEIVWPDKIYEVLYNCGEEAVDLTEFDLGVINLKTDFEKSVKNLATALKGRPHDERLEIMDYLLKTYGGTIKKRIEDFRLMDKMQIVDLAEGRQFAIGVHTNSHPILSTMTATQQEREVADSMARLEDWGIKPLKVFAYPNGRRQDYNNETINVIRRLGFRAAVTTIDGLHDPVRDKSYHIRRLLIGADISFLEFKARLSGFYYFIRKLATK